MKFRLQIYTARLQATAPEFTETKAAAMRRRKALRAAGYIVHVFQVSATGGLLQVA